MCKVLTRKKRGNIIYLIQAQNASVEYLIRPAGRATFPKGEVLWNARQP